MGEQLALSRFDNVVDQLELEIIVETNLAIHHFHDPIVSVDHLYCHVVEVVVLVVVHSATHVQACVQGARVVSQLTLEESLFSVLRLTLDFIPFGYVCLEGDDVTCPTSPDVTNLITEIWYVEQ